MAKELGGRVVVRAPDGTLGTVDQSDYNSFLQRGYTPASDEEAGQAQQAAIQEAGPLKAIQSGLAVAPELTADQAFAAAGESIIGSGSFGLLGPRDEQAQLRAQLFEDQYPISSMAAQALPAVAAYAALPGLAGATSAAGRAGAFLGRAAVEGSMYAGEAARREGRDFSYTEAAVAGITGEVFGAALGWTATRAAGGYRNLVQGATQRSVARDVEKGLGGGWLKDYQAAAYADDYVGEAARAATKDLDGVLTDFPEVASIARKRDRIVEVISRNPNGQRAFASDLSTKLTELRQTLADTAGEGGGPAKSLFKDLDNIIEEWHSLSANLRQTDGQEIFKQADKLRQTVHEYVAEIAQDIYDDPARAVLSKEGLRTLESFRDYLVGGLKDGNVWGQAAADFQKVYNEAFHKKFFPAQKIVNGRLMQVTGKDARGFAVRQAEPGKIMRLLKREATAEETAAGLSAEMTRTYFNQWLDGIETIALEAAGEAPDKAKKLLNHVQRLRNTAVVGDQIQDAVTRHGKRVAFGEAAGGAALGVAALGDVSGAVAGALILRRGVSGVRQMHWLGDALNSLGWFRGKKASIEAILNKGTDIIDRRIAGANLRQALKRPAKAALPVGQADEFYQLGKGPKALPPWEREVDLTNEAEFLGPYTLRPSDYSLDDPAPTPRALFERARTERPGGGTNQGMFVTRQEVDPESLTPTPRAMFENARTELPGGDTKQGMFVTRQEVEQLKEDLRQSGPQGQKVADFLDEHDGELPHVGQPKVDAEAPTELPRVQTEARPEELTSLPEPVNGFMSPANVGPAWPTKMPSRDARLLAPSEVPEPGAGTAELQALFDKDRAKLVAEGADPKALDVEQAAMFDPAPPKVGTTTGLANWKAENQLAQMKQELEDRGFKRDALDILNEKDLKRLHAREVKNEVKPTTGAGPQMRLDGIQPFKAADFPGLQLEAGLQKRFMVEPVRGRGHQGITTAGWFKGEDGIERYVKIQQDPAMAVSEHLANRFLKDFGFLTNDSVLFELKQGGHSYLAYATERLGNEWDKLSVVKPSQEAAQEFGHLVAADTLLGNWDRLTNPGNTFSNGQRIFALDNGGAGVFHASGEYRFVHKPIVEVPDRRFKAGIRMDEGKRPVAGPLGERSAKAGQRQMEQGGDPAIDWMRLKHAADTVKFGREKIQKFGEQPADIVANVLGIQDRKAFRPLIEQGFERIQAVKQQYGGWYEYVEMRAKELPKQYRRDLVQLLTSREEWLRRNIPFLSVAPFLGAAAIEDLAESLDNAEKDGLASMPSEPWINSVESFRRDQEKLLSDTVSNLFGGNRRSRVLSSSVGRFKEDQPDLRTAFLEKRARLEALVNNPGEMVSRVTEGLRDMPQEAFAASAGGIGRTVAFLQSKFPQRPPEWQRDVPVNEMKMREIAEYWDAATNPRGLMEDFRDTGRLTQPQLEVLQTLYPDQLVKLQAGIMEKLQDGPPPSLEARKQVERILGQTGAAEPAFSKTVGLASQLAYEQAAQVQAPPQATPGNSKASAASAQPAGISALRRA